MVEWTDVTRDGIGCAERVQFQRQASDRRASNLIVGAFLLALLPLGSVSWETVSQGISRFDLAFFTNSMRNVVGAGGGARAFEHHVDAVRAGQLVDQFLEVFLLDVDGVVGAELFRHAEAVGVYVGAGDDDGPRPGRQSIRADCRAGGTLTFQRSTCLRLITGV